MELVWHAVFLEFHRRGKRQCESIVFFCQSLCEGGISFQIKREQPNKESIMAMMEQERTSKDPIKKGNKEQDELFEELKK